MGVLEKVKEYVRSVNGVVDVIDIDDTMSQEIQNIERSIRTKSNHDYKNVGYDIAMKKRHMICVIFVGGYLFEKRAVLKLMTEDGTIMGTSLKPNEIEEYRDREDVIWISEDFVVFPNIVGKGEEAFVLYPFDIPEITEAVPECVAPIGVSPTPSADAYIKGKAGIPVTKELFTSIIAFDE